jgi:CheY-like chemotaxis protein
LRSGIEAAMPGIERRRQRLQVVLPPEPVGLQVDVLRFAQVVANLLDNASKFSDSDAVIRLEASLGDRHSVLVRVIDHGEGIPLDLMPGVFDLFTQAQTSLDRSAGGLGIGLALVKGLVELHGGTVSAASEGPGRGSRFVVDLPVAEGSTPCERRPVAPAPGPGSEAVQAQRVLLADDNRDAADMLSTLLRLAGHEVLTAYDGPSALELVLRHRPEVVVLDIGMPGLNGYEVARQVRARAGARQPLLVAATGWGQQEDRRKATAAGFDAHLTKPFDPRALTELMAAHAAAAAPLSASSPAGSHA